MMGTNDAGEMLAVAKAEVVRLEREVAALRAQVALAGAVIRVEVGRTARARSVAAHLLESLDSWR
jgi:hypothetical protein